MNALSRHERVRLPGYGGSYALFSIHDETDTAVVFVHGYGGDPTTTWLNFQGLVDNDKGDPHWWRKADLYFFRYASVNAHLMASGDKLVEFVDELFPAPARALRTVPVDRVVDGRFVQDEVTISAGQRYSQLVLVGHSEGGLVIRQAIIDKAQRVGTTELRTAEASDSPDFFRAQVRLFAPALLGVRLSGIVGVLFETPLLGSAAKMFVPGSRSYADMDNPAKIAELKDTTMRWRDEHAGLAAFKARSCWGDVDSIVTPGVYPGENFELVRGKNHNSVCKPDFDYLKPLEFVSAP